LRNGPDVACRVSVVFRYVAEKGRVHGAMAPSQPHAAARIRTQEGATRCSVRRLHKDRSARFSGSKCSEAQPDTQLVPDRSPSPDEGQSRPRAHWRDPRHGHDPISRVRHCEDAGAQRGDEGAIIVMFFPAPRVENCRLQAFLASQNERTDHSLCSVLRPLEVLMRNPNPMTSYGRRVFAHINHKEETDPLCG